MNPARRSWLAALGGVALPAAGESGDEVRRGRVLGFPRDHGAHPGARTEWWYLTGWLGREAAPTHGFQITFFRSRTGLADTLPGRLAPRQLLFAHAALTDLASGRHHHDQRLMRWNGDAADSGRSGAARADTRAWIGDWQLQRESGAYRTAVAAQGWALDLSCRVSQPLLLQGDAGFSRKGPLDHQASHYYSWPQLAVQGQLRQAGAAQAASGRAWLDHEWSEAILAAEAVGWDWIGFNLFDGAALTAFVLRRADGSALWAGGSHRDATGALRIFGPTEVAWTPRRHWRSAATGARYPVELALTTPAGRWDVRALLDAQELDGSRSTGTVYWEGLSELLDAGGRRVGLGYLEMTGYAGPRLRL